MVWLSVCLSVNHLSVNSAFIHLSIVTNTVPADMDLGSHTSIMAMNVNRSARNISIHDLPLWYPFQIVQTQHSVVCSCLVVLLLKSTADQVYGPWLQEWPGTSVCIQQLPLCPNAPLWPPNMEHNCGFKNTKSSINLYYH